MSVIFFVFYFVFRPLCITFAVMKQFIKFTFATILGLFVFNIIAGILCFSTIAGMFAIADSPVRIEDNTVFSLRLSGQVEERSTPGLMSQFGDASEMIMGLDDILSAIKAAKVNDKIKGIYLEAGMFSAGDPATAHAIRQQLADFKESGKWIVAYGDTYTQTTYYICSIADHLWLNPQGMVVWQGMSAEPIFLKGMLEKFGISVQLVKVGKYKSAPETYTADEMSQPNREQVTAYLSGIWDTMVADVAQSRNLSAEVLNAYADGMVTLAAPEDYVSKGLVDSLLYTDDVKLEVKRLMGLSEDDDIRQVTLAEMSAMPAPDEKGDEVAVYYAYGTVVDSRTGNILGDEACIDARQMTHDLEELASDDDVKAVVLRINSGGGSAYASEQIWHAVSRLKAEKPVVVSMGGYAASGAYYISCASDAIYADPTTLTGSIGIFGMFPDVSQLLKDKLGLRFDAVKTNKFSDFGTLSRPFNAEERAYLESYIDRGYALFRQRVADGRGMPVDSVEQIAQGHVWLATDAVDIGLVDKLGSLDDAVAAAARLAELDEWHVAAYPELPTWMDMLFEEVTDAKGTYLDSQMRHSLGELYYPLKMAVGADEFDAVQALMPYRVTMR